MFSFGKSKRTANIVIDDYVIRMVENNGKDLASLRIVAEKPIPNNIIDNGRVVDEPEFYEFMKTTVQEWGIRNRSVRFFVPQSIMILREIELLEDVKKTKRKDTYNVKSAILYTFNLKNQSTTFIINVQSQIK